MKTKTEANREPWVKEYVKGDHSEDKVIIKSGDEWIATVNADHIGTIWSALNGIRAAEKLEEAMLALRDARMLLMMNRAVAGSATMTRINNVIAEAKEVLR